MSFNYDVMSEEEAQKAREFQLLPDGLYDFAVTEAKIKYSKNGNAMIELKLRIIHDGQEYNVFDNLIATRNMVWKTKHFCEGTGLQKEYLAGQFNEHFCAQRRGTAAITNVPARPKEDGSRNPDGSPAMWKAKNEVADYMSPDSLTQKSKAASNPFAPPASKASEVAPPAAAEEFFDDTIPF